MAQSLLEAFDPAVYGGRPLFIPYVITGFPFLDNMHEQLLTLEEKGAGLIELGVPFSDAVADGPVIQEASTLALSRSAVTIDDAFHVVKMARKCGLKVPVILMTYYNLIFSYGHANFIDNCAASGVNGLIIVDLPLDHAGDLYERSLQKDVSLVPLITITSKEKKLDKLLNFATSFVYVVSSLGVTGSQLNPYNSELWDLLEKLKDKTSVPIVVGFGVRNRETFEALSNVAHGVVVGTSIITALNSVKDHHELVIPKLEEIVDEIIPEYITKNNANSIVSTPSHFTNSPRINNSDYFLNTELAGFFGKYGGQYVPEIFSKCLEEFEEGFIDAINDPKFLDEIKESYSYIGRKSKLYFAKGLTDFAQGANIWLKREDLNHTGSHKINNAYGQALIAKRLKKKRIIAETGAGQHGVATATVCAKLGLECEIYMGEVDTIRQKSNVLKMKLLGANVIPVKSGTRTLKDAVNEALRDWSTNIKNTHYLIGSAVGPHPFPTVVRRLQLVIGEEIRAEFLKKLKKLPDVLVACVGGGSNAIGMFHPFINDKSVKMFGVEAGGIGVDSGKHAATLTSGRDGVLHGSRTLILQNSEGQISETYSICAGLDYPGVGPEHAHLRELKRVTYVSVTDEKALDAFKILSRLEGIIPALESSHAVYYALLLAREMGPGKDIVVCLSGRGDKDIDIITSEPYLNNMVSSDLPKIFEKDANNSLSW